MAVKSAEVSLSASIQKEREALQNIGPCPHIIRCFGDEITTGNNGEMVYNLLQEYGSGGTLADLIKKSNGSGLPEHEVKYYSRSILRGLHRIHVCGYVHCDIKPENILLVMSGDCSGRKYRVKIGDLGLAKRSMKNKKRKLKLDPYWRGTPTYLSPEAVIDSVQEAPSDIWAFGCVVLEMLTGTPAWGPLEDLEPKALLDRIGKGGELPKIPEGMSKEGREFLRGCFSRNPSFRLTAEMLLNHSFLEGLADDDKDEVDIEADDEEEDDLFTDQSGLSSTGYETEEDYDEGALFWDDDCGFVSGDELLLDQDNYSLNTVGMLSDEETMNAASSGGNSEIGEVVSTTEEVSTNALQQEPISYTISAGV